MQDNWINFFHGINLKSGKAQVIDSLRVGLHVFSKIDPKKQASSDTLALGWPYSCSINLKFGEPQMRSKCWV